MSFSARFHRKARWLDVCGGSSLSLSLQATESHFKVRVDSKLILIIDSAVKAGL
jgi:hypothetical protein